MFKWWNRRVIQHNSWKFVGIKSLCPRIACQDAGQPLPMPACNHLDGRPIDPAPSLRKCLQLLQRGIKKAQTAGKGAPLDVVIGGGKLNQTLKKEMDFGLCLEPDRLP